MEPKKLLFFGTPEFAVPALEALVKAEGLTVVAVVTQPDKPAGRGNKLKAPPVKEKAKELGARVFQPNSLKSINLQDHKLSSEKSASELCQFLNDAGPIDVGVCVAYGKIIPAPVLQYPKLGIVNIHPSLLPRWRGAAPIQRALFEGDKETGISIMMLDEGLDTGPVLTSRSIPIGSEENFGELHNRLSELGAEDLARAITGLLSGEISPTPQPEDGLTYAEKWEGDDLVIHWNEPAEVTHRRIRTCSPHQGARAWLKGKMVKVFQSAELEFLENGDAAAGTVVKVGDGQIVVSCGEGQKIALRELQFEGKKRMPVSEILKGSQVQVGDVFSERPKP